MTLRVPAISSANYYRLCIICSAASGVYRPIDPAHPGPPPVYLAPVIAVHRPFMMRAHALLAQEVVAFLATTTRARGSGDPTDYYLRPGSGGPGGLGVARWFETYGLGQPFIHPGGTVPQAAGPYEAYITACAAVGAGLAQLELDLSASSAADALIDPALAAEATGRIGGVH